MSFQCFLYFYCFLSIALGWVAKDNVEKGGLQGTVGSLSMEVGCSAKDNPSKGGSLRGTVGSLSTREPRVLCKESK